jgi:hypothetical protein
MRAVATVVSPKECRRNEAVGSTGTLGSCIYGSCEPSDDRGDSTPSLVERSTDMLDVPSSSSGRSAVLTRAGEIVGNSTVKGVPTKLEEGASLEGEDVVSTCNASCTWTIMREAVREELRDLPASFLR